MLTSTGVDVTDEQLSSLRNAALEPTAHRPGEGVIMEREGIEADGAYSILCNYSRRSNRPFRERAEEVVASTSGPTRSRVRTEARRRWLRYRRPDSPPTCSTGIARRRPLSRRLVLRYFELGE